MSAVAVAVSVAVSVSQTKRCCRRVAATVAVVMKVMVVKICRSCLINVSFTRSGASKVCVFGGGG